MNCFKRLGKKVMARTFERQVVELNIRASILNQFTALGTHQPVAAAKIKNFAAYQRQLKKVHSVRATDLLLTNQER